MLETWTRSGGGGVIYGDFSATHKKDLINIFAAKIFILSCFAVCRPYLVLDFFERTSMTSAFPNDGDVNNINSETSISESRKGNKTVSFYQYLRQI